MGRHFTGFWVYRKILRITTRRMRKFGILTVMMGCYPYLAGHKVNIKRNLMYVCPCNVV